MYSKIWHYAPKILMPGEVRNTLNLITEDFLATNIHLILQRRNSNGWLEEVDEDNLEPLDLITDLVEPELSIRVWFGNSMRDKFIGIRSDSNTIAIHIEAPTTEFVSSILNRLVQ